MLTHADARFQPEKERKSFTATIYAASVPQPGHPNEDAFFVGRLPGAPLAAVFDGQGNAEGVAKKAARQLERLYTDSRGKLDWMKTAKLLDSHLLGANKSTMVTASLAGTVSICAVGDSRALADFEKLYQRQTSESEAVDQAVDEDTRKETE